MALLSSLARTSLPWTSLLLSLEGSPCATCQDLPLLQSPTEVPRPAPPVYGWVGRLFPRAHPWMEWIWCQKAQVSPDQLHLAGWPRAGHITSLSLFQKLLTRIRILSPLCCLGAGLRQTGNKSSSYDVLSTCPALAFVLLLHVPSLYSLQESFRVDSGGDEAQGVCALPRPSWVRKDRAEPMGLLSPGPEPHPVMVQAALDLSQGHHIPLLWRLLCFQLHQCCVGVCVRKAPLTSLPTLAAWVLS